LGWFWGCFASIQILAASSDLGRNRANVPSKGAYWRRIAQKMRTLESAMERVVAERSAAAKVRPTAQKENSAPQNPTLPKKTAWLSIAAARRGGKNVKILNPSALKLLPKAKFVSPKTSEKISEEVSEKTPEKNSIKIPEKVFEEVPEKIPEKNSVKTSEKASEGVPEKVSEKTSKEEKPSSSGETVTIHWDEFTLPQGYKLQNVPGDGLCGFWAVLAALKVKEKGNAASVHVERKEVFDLLKRLSDRIKKLVKKENKTEEEQEMVRELDQLIRDGYAKDHDDLVCKLERGEMQLDSPIATFLAQEIGYTIVLRWQGIRKGEMIFVLEQYVAKSPQEVTMSPRKVIVIQYFGNGSGGHYWAVVPVGANVSFN
jgi:hypothetical protein